MNLASIAIVISISNIAMLICIILYLRHSSFSRMQHFAERQAALYTALRNRQKNDSATDAAALMALKSDVEYFVAMQKQNEFKFHALDNAFKLHGMDLLSKRWNTNLQITRNIDEKTV